MSVEFTASKSRAFKEFGKHIAFTWTREGGFLIGESARQFDNASDVIKVVGHEGLHYAVFKQGGRESELKFHNIGSTYASEDDYTGLKKRLVRR